MRSDERTAIIVVEGGVAEVVRGDVLIFDLDNLDAGDEDSISSVHSQLRLARKIGAPKRLLNELEKRQHEARP